MIGKPEWFERRKYSGWGLHPKTWQGWAYLAVVMLPFVIFQSFPYWSTEIRMVATVIWISFLLADTLHIMFTLKRDEREQKIEAISERNAAWSMMLVLVFGLLYQMITSALDQAVQIDWFLAAALIAGAIIKSVSNIVLERRAL